MTDKDFQEFMIKHMTDLSEEVNEFRKTQNKLSDEIRELSQSQVRMENELTEKVRGLYDFREVQNDVNERLISALDRIEAKVDVLQLETAHLRRVK